MKIVCISDTHQLHRQLKIPECDILLHAGDITFTGEHHVLEDFNDWLGSLENVKHKIVIAGNHDLSLENNDNLARKILSNASYLYHESITVEGLKIFGSPFSPRFCDWAFNVDRGEPLRKLWENIPQNTDILLTHGPPWGILDKTANGKQVGCEDLLRKVVEIKPKIHCFGHIHEGYGTLALDGTVFVNASSVDKTCRKINQPIFFGVKL